MAIMLLLFLVANLLTASRSPTVWQDEVMFTDPAVNLATGHGFTSTAWGFQTREQLWAGNAPLHSLLLAPWIKIFGVSPTSARSINYLYMVTAALLLWLGLARNAVIRNSFWRLFAVLLFLTGYCLSFNYRSARYDCLGMLLLALAFYSVSFTGWKRMVGLVVPGFLLSATGLHLLPFATLFGILVSVYFGFSKLRYFIIAGIASVAGFLTMLAIFHANGVMDQFFGSVRSFSSSSGSRFSPANLSAVLHEPGILLLSGVALLLTGFDLFKHSFKWRSPLGFALGVMVVMPLGMTAFRGEMPVYYCWMVFIPLSIAVAATLDGGAVERPGYLRAIAGLLLLVAALAGLPLRLLITASEWSKRDYAPVEAFVQRNVTSSDWIYCDYAAFYAAKRAAAVVLLPGYAERVGVPPDEAARVRVLIVAPANFAAAQALIGGKWEKQKDELIPPGDQNGSRHGAALYHLAVYNRSPV